MNCIKCGTSTGVIDSRVSREENFVRRRRGCDNCGEKFTTYELPPCAKTDAVLKSAREALLWATEMFRARDEMNAKVHCAPIRYSPITERCQMAFDALADE